MALAQDVTASRRPAAIVATVGTTGTTAVDPLAQIAPLARQYGAWLHVDAAMAGSALMLPEMRWLVDGVEDADSLAWNPHKWLGTVLDCSLLYVADPDHLVRVMSTSPSYLRSAVDGEVTQYKDWGIPLGRRFRALKLWFHLRLDGAEAIRARLRRDLDNARWLAGQVSAAPGWRVLAPVNLQTVVLRHEPPGTVSPAGQVLNAGTLDAHTLGWPAGSTPRARPWSPRPCWTARGRSGSQSAPNPPSGMTSRRCGGCCRKKPRTAQPARCWPSFERTC